MYSRFVVTRTLVKTLAVSILATSMGGCLSGGGGGGGSSSDKPAPPVVEVPEPVDPMVARTLQGDFQGIELDDMRVFRGIRYATPPKGELRFAAPFAADAHDGVLELSERFGSACPQKDLLGVATSLEEDCLFLNVYVPAQPGDYPVMVWLHGGGMLDGSAGDQMYRHPQRLVVEHDVIVVTLNYRLGTLGFLPHEDLGVNNNNFGIQDQQLALRWVQDNIEAFGGDKSNVTLFGESAGGHSVMSHLASPGSADLFHKAIVQSGSYLGTQLPLKDIQNHDHTVLLGGQTRMAKPILDSTRCAGLVAQELVTCLRELDVEEILDSQMDWMLPVYGTPTLPLSINDAIKSGAFNKMPVMMGSNLNEGELYGLVHLSVGPEGIGDLWYEAGYYRQVRELLKNHYDFDADTIAADYLAQETTRDGFQFFRARSRIETDYRYTCPNAEQWNLLHDQDVSVWGYWFADEGAPGIPSTFGILPDVVGAAHAYEVPYLLMPFGEVFTQENGASEAQIELAERMTAYWANFAKYGEPSIADGTDTSGWPQYTKGNAAMENLIIRFEAPQPAVVPVSQFLQTHNCSYWVNPPKRPVRVPVSLELQE